MNKLLSKSGQIQYGISEFLINTDDEVSTLPLNVPIGSSAMSMATGTFFFLRKEGNQLKWLPVDGGGSGTSDYSQLTNKPTINGVELNGVLSADDLGLATATQNILSSSLAWGKETHGAVDSGAIILPSVENANIVNELTYIFSASSANLSITAPSNYILGDDNGFAGLSVGNTITYTDLTVGNIYEMSFKVLDTSHIGMVKKEWKTA